MRSEKLLLTPAEVAELLSVSRTTVYELLNRGLLPSIKLGSCRRIPIDGVRQLIDQLAAGHE